MKSIPQERRLKPNSRGSLRSTSAGAVAHLISPVRLQVVPRPGADKNVIPQQPLPTAFRIFSSGKVETTKGIFQFDGKAANSVMKAWKSYGNDIQIDYEHKSVDPASRAGDGLAAGWCRLEVRNGELWAVDVRWTASAADKLREGAWKYMSPTFDYDSKSGRITELLNVALTNIPATKKLPPLVAAGKASIGGAVKYAHAPTVDVKWDAAAAVKRLQKWAGVDKPDAPASAWRKYASGFAWYDVTKPDQLGSYKLPHHDIVGGKFVTVRQGVIAAGNVIVGGRGGVNIPEKDITAVKQHLAAHYHEFDLKAPWEPKESNMATKQTKASKKNARLGVKKTKKTVTETTEQDDESDVTGPKTPGKDIAVDELDEADEMDEADEADEADADDMDESDDSDQDDSDSDQDDDSDQDSDDDSQYTDELDEADEADEMDDADDKPGPAIPAKKMKKAKKSAKPCAKTSRSGQRRVLAAAARAFGTTDPDELEGAFMGVASLKRQVEKAQSQITAINAKTRKANVAAMVEAAIKCGKLTPAQREQFVEVGTKSPKMLKGLLSTMPKRLNIDGEGRREAGDKGGLANRAELEVVRRAAPSVFEDYAKASKTNGLLPLTAFLGDENS